MDERDFQMFWERLEGIQFSLDKIGQTLETIARVLDRLADSAEKYDDGS